MDQVTTICGTARLDGAVLCNFAPDHEGLHSWEMAHALRTAQPWPVHNDSVSIHQLVIADILSRDVHWDLSIGPARHIRDRVADDLLARRNLGTMLYGTPLQAHNGRNALLDMYEELLDAACYARQYLAEDRPDSVEYMVMFEVYDDIVSYLPRVRRMLDAASE